MFLITTPAGFVFESPNPPEFRNGQVVPPGGSLRLGYRTNVLKYELSKMELNSWHDLEQASTPVIDIPVAIPASSPVTAVEPPKVTFAPVVQSPTKSMGCGCGG